MHIVGIDLGTTNSALAFTADAESGARLLPDSAACRAWRRARTKALLPSFLYIPGAKRVRRKASLALPWDEQPAASGGAIRAAARLGKRRAAGHLGEELAFESAARTGRAANLPWQAPEGVEKISAIDASAEYLRHLASRLESGAPRGADRSTRCSGHGSGVVRRVRARTDVASRQAGGTGRSDAARRAAGRLLRVAGRAPAMARNGAGGRSDSGDRHRRRDDGLLADRGGNQARRSRARTHRRRANTFCWAATTSIWRWPTRWPRGWRRRARASTTRNCRRSGIAAGQGKEKLLEPGSTAEAFPVTILGQGQQADRRVDQGGAAPVGHRAGVWRGSSPWPLPDDMPQRRRGRLGRTRAALCDRTQR